jgi:hypothetical protein
MMQLLSLHPASERSCVRWIQVEIDRSASDSLRITYKIGGDIEGIEWPPYRGGGRADELWRHTCFELFLMPVGDEAYLEFNFSPSIEWAAYSFDGYRSGMRNVSLDPDPRIRFTGGKQGAMVEADLQGLPEAKWRLNAAAVIEEKDGAKSYWALKHPPGAPDFHHPDCFALELPA